ncbi:ATP-binding protein [Kitasatospora sp. RB6PN24]|uniref:ATP-binding protein n=1 Tax=Kitasatospora humi TaxID=2893891 RepID=UPI001E34742A|nr:ATP-binding protein [Kitasatospora humi]MCC9307342.1 ATP-binding protein [Kitasatospora humi]
MIEEQNESRSATPELDLATLGFYLQPQPDGFVLHMSASREHVQAMRSHVFKAVTGAGVDEDTADSARLVASELVGNAVRLCGPWAPVVVRVVNDAEEVKVQVHDPEPSVVPRRSRQLPDNVTAETGRGLWILDAIAPGWSVEPSPIGKQISCILPRPRPEAN